MVSIHSANRNWEELTKVYTELEDLCRQIEESNKSDSRMFSNYYYVQFMGTAVCQSTDLRACSGSRNTH
jgi:hypothetical protein